MSKETSGLQKNAILNGLTAEDRGKLADAGELTTFKLRERVYDAEERISDVYFPLGAVLSVVSRMQDGGEIEIGTIGREGMSGIPVLMGSQTTANNSFCQVDGEAWKVPVEAFRQLLGQSETFRDLLNRYLQAYINMLGQFVACNRLHSVFERACRWILMTQDRVGHDEFPLTHEFLATMLGSRRSGVSIAAATLQRAGFIQYARGHITVIDRHGLETAACECYFVTKRQFDEMLRPSISMDAHESAPLNRSNTSNER